MGFFWKTTLSKRQRVVALYRDGWPVRDIARHCGISKSYVIFLAAKAGLPLRNR